MGCAGGFNSTSLPGKSPRQVAFFHGDDAARSLAQPQWLTLLKRGTNKAFLDTPLLQGVCQVCYFWPASRRASHPALSPAAGEIQVHKANPGDGQRDIDPGQLIAQSGHGRARPAITPPTPTNNKDKTFPQGQKTHAMRGSVACKSVRRRHGSMASTVRQESGLQNIFRVKNFAGPNKNRHMVLNFVCDRDDGMVWKKPSYWCLSSRRT